MKTNFYFTTTIYSDIMFLYTPVLKRHILLRFFAPRLLKHGTAQKKRIKTYLFNTTLINHKKVM